jgi:UDP-glucose 4-epimerase
MRILLTGGSSFTGFWFGRALAEAGHEVLATLQKPIDQYEGLRLERLKLLETAGAHFIPSSIFGDDQFIHALRTGVDVIAHHGANVENYKSPDFDVVKALRDNTYQLSKVLDVARASNVRGLVLTGSVFEQDEGMGNQPLRAFSPYGLSKGLTWQVFRYECERRQVPLHKFVIPNPFGPFEEPRFCQYLVNKWRAGEVPQINTPDYVRDNIHISLLAQAYVELIERTGGGAPGSQVGPSGYVETQQAFATRFALELGERLGIETPLLFGKQTDFSEPMCRANADRIRPATWDESAAWDAVATYYAPRFAKD